MTEELNSQNQELNDFIKKTETTDEGNSSEEQISKEETSETSETSENSSENQEFNPDQETVDLIKSIRGEVGEKRFDGLMAAWQRDRTKLQSQTKQPQQQTSQTESKPQGDDDLVEYLRKKFTEKEMAEKESQDKVVEEELERVQIQYPQYSRDKILKTAIDYSDSETNPISLMTAAKILEGLSKGVNASKTLKEDGEAKKKDAAKIAGRSGYQQSTGLRKYNPEKDGNKSLSELIKEGAEELGM